MHLQLNHDQLEMLGCILSTVDNTFSGAIVPGHQDPLCWRNIHFIEPVSYQNTTLIVKNMGKYNCILKKMTQLFKG